MVIMITIIIISITCMLSVERIECTDEWYDHQSLPVAGEWRSLDNLGHDYLHIYIDKRLKCNQPDITLMLKDILQWTYTTYSCGSRPEYNQDWV